MKLTLAILIIFAITLFLRRAKEKKQVNTDIYERQLEIIRKLSAK